MDRTLYFLGSYWNGTDDPDDHDFIEDKDGQSSDDEEEQSEEDGEGDSEWEDVEENKNDDGDNANSDTDADEIFNVILEGIQVIRCDTHTLALAVGDTLKTSKKKGLKNSVDWRNFYGHHWIYVRLKKCKLKVPQLNAKTRWNSTYDMLLSLKKLRSYCLDKGIQHLNKSDWNFCDTFLEVFQPVKIATKYLQKEQLSFGDFFKCWIKLTLKIKDLSQTIPLASKLYDKILMGEAYFFENKFSQKWGQIISMLHEPSNTCFNFISTSEKLKWELIKIEKKIALNCAGHWHKLKQRKCFKLIETYLFS